MHYTQLTLNHHPHAASYRYSNLGDEAAEAIGEALKTNTALHHLDFGYGNKVLFRGVTGLSDGLKVNKALESLHLGGNVFYGAGGEALGQALQHNKASI